MAQSVSVIVPLLYSPPPSAEDPRFSKLLSWRTRLITPARLSTLRHFGIQVALGWSLLMRPTAAFEMSAASQKQRPQRLSRCALRPC